MQEITLKHNNIISLSCNTSQSIGGNTVISAILQGGIRTALPVTIIDNNNFTVVIDTSVLTLGWSVWDIKIGNVSSESITVMIEQEIA
jgi:hypothetical protein